MSEIVRMEQGDEFTLVLPKANTKKKNVPSLQRCTILSLMKTILMHGKPSTEDKDEYFSKRLGERTITRESCDYYEFNFVVHKFPEREDLQKRGLKPATLCVYVSRNCTAS